MPSGGGSGFRGILIFVLLAVIVARLMDIRTPEHLGNGADPASRLPSGIPQSIPTTAVKN